MPHWSDAVVGGWAAALDVFTVEGRQAPCLVVPYWAAAVAVAGGRTGWWLLWRWTGSHTGW